ncbi:8670_t:CDS:2, partial [Funneliformis geosporum]
LNGESQKVWDIENVHYCLTEFHPVDKVKHQLFTGKFGKYSGGFIIDAMKIDEEKYTVKSTESDKSI